MSYKLKFSRQFQKDFAKLDSQVQAKVLVVLEKMQNKPLLGVKKLKKVKEGVFRKRLGDYRLRFDIFKKEVHLYRLRHRKDVYKT